MVTQNTCKEKKFASSTNNCINKSCKLGREDHQLLWDQALSKDIMLINIVFF